MGAVSGTPSPGCNGRGRRAGRGGARRGRGLGRARAGRASPLRAALPFLRPVPAPRCPALPHTHPPRPGPPPARTRLGFPLAPGCLRAQDRAPSHVDCCPLGGGPARETPEAARGPDRRSERGSARTAPRHFARRPLPSSWQSREERPGGPGPRGVSPAEEVTGAHREDVAVLRRARIGCTVAGRGRSPCRWLG